MISLQSNVQTVLLMDQMDQMDLMDNFILLPQH